MAAELGGRRREGRLAKLAADSCPFSGLGAPKKAPEGRAGERGSVPNSPLIGSGD